MEATELSTLEDGDDGIQGFPSLLYSSSGLCQPAQSNDGSKEYHAVITPNICVKRTVRQLRGNKDKYTGRESIKVIDVEKVHPWNFFLWPQYNSTVRQNKEMKS
jgi:hypothetical protein